MPGDVVAVAADAIVAGVVDGIVVADDVVAVVDDDVGADSSVFDFRVDAFAVADAVGVADVADGTVVVAVVGDAAVVADEGVVVATSAAVVDAAMRDAVAVDDDGGAVVVGPKLSEFEHYLMTSDDLFAVTLAQ